MVRHADIAEQGEDMLRNPVVEHALAADRALFLGVERGRVVLEILDQRARFGALVKDLRFAFVNLAATGHGVQTFCRDQMNDPGKATQTEARRRGDGAPIAAKVGRVISHVAN